MENLKTSEGGPSLDTKSGSTKNFDKPACPVDKCREFLAELDNRIDEFNASLPTGVTIMIDNPFDVGDRGSWGGRNLSLSVAYCHPSHSTTSNLKNNS